MKVPKMLPWLARKAGVSDARAEQLWTEAVQYATVRTGWVGTSEYWHTAVERLLELLKQEREKAGQATLSRIIFWQTRAWMWPSIVWQSSGIAMSRAWSRWLSGHLIAL